MPRNTSTTRRALLCAAVAPWLNGCRLNQAEVLDTEPSGRFKDIGGAEMVVDAVEGAELEGVEFFDDRGTWVFASSVISRA